MDVDAYARRVLLARALELAVERAALDGRLAGPAHSSLGHEWVAALVTGLLDGGDWVVPYYRSHAWLLARGVPPGDLLAAVTTGRGDGTMHLGSRDHRVVPANAYVAQHVPFAAGLAWGLAEQGPAVVACPVGDGALASGLVAESLATARRWGAPLLVVVEDNGLQNYEVSSASDAPDAGAVAAAAGVPCLRLRRDAVVTAVVRDRLAALVADVRARRAPAVLWCDVTLEHPHSFGPGGPVAALPPGALPAPALVPVWLRHHLGALGVGPETLDGMAAEALAGVHDGAATTTGASDGR